MGPGRGSPSRSWRVDHRPWPRLLDGSVLLVGGAGHDRRGGHAARVRRAVLTRRRSAGPRWARWPRRVASGHTATTLLDGRVLVVGGTEFAGLPSAELYDPDTLRLVADRLDARGPVRSHGHAPRRRPRPRHRWLDRAHVRRRHRPRSTTRRPGPGPWWRRCRSERVGHTATLLDDGTVLVSGGHLANRGSPVRRPASERFDPATGRWSDAGSMLVGRYQHTATLLVRRQGPHRGRPHGRRRDRGGRAVRPERWLLDPDNRHDPRPAGAGRGAGCRTTRCWSWAATRRAAARPPSASSSS